MMGGVKLKCGKLLKCKMLNKNAEKCAEQRVMLKKVWND